MPAAKRTIIAGGTDLLGTLKDNILPTYPATVINIKTIPGLDYIKEEAGMLKIGATTRLADIAANPAINQKYTALAQAASRVATPHVRDMGTIGGNIAQLHRCWYFRKPENRFNCVRKGGTTVLAMAGDNRYHSIFGVVNKCIAVHPSDMAPALIALNAKIVTTRARSRPRISSMSKSRATPCSLRRNHHGNPGADASCRRQERVSEVRYPQVDRFPDRELRRDGGRRSAADLR